MVLDIRLDTGFPFHEKTLRLQRALGVEGPWSLLRLWLWAREHRSKGRLAGMGASDIERVSDWRGAPGAFVAALVDHAEGSSGFLDVDADGTHVLHGWSERQSWAMGQTSRSLAAKIAGKASARSRAATTKNDRSTRRSTGAERIVERFREPPLPPHQKGEGGAGPFETVPPSPENPEPEPTPETHPHLFMPLPGGHFQDLRALRASIAADESYNPRIRRAK